MTRHGSRIGHGTVASLAAAGGLLLLLSPAISMAQTGAAGASPSTGALVTSRGEGDPGDIIVTARRREERLQDVPISITVLNQDEVTRANIANATDLAIRTPSLSANTLLGSNSATFAIRGFVQELGTPPSVGAYFADVVAPRGATPGQSAGDGVGPGSFFDLQNVQVLKGPQGTLFGRNTTGGAILLVPQKPTGRFEGYLEGSVGNYDMRRLQGVLNAPFGDAVRLRVGGDFQKRDGYLRNISGIGPRDFNDIDYYALRASLVIDIAPNIENYTIGSYSKSDTNGELLLLRSADPTNPGGFPLAFFALGAQQRIAAAGGGRFGVEQAYSNPFSRQVVWQGINTTTWEASDALTIKNIISYGELKVNSERQLFGTLADLADLNPVLPFLGFPAGFQLPAGTIVGISDINDPFGGDLAHQSTFTEEFQLQGRGMGGRLVWQAGAYYEKSSPVGLSGSSTTILVGCADRVNPPCANPLGFGALSDNEARTSFRGTALYAQASLDLTDRLKATAGFRYTWDRTVATYGVRNLTFPQSFAPVGSNGFVCQKIEASPADQCRQRFEQKSDAPTWLLGLDYKPTDDLLLYAKYARGYRSGGVAPNAPDVVATFDQEKVDAYEIGSKLSFDGAVRGNFNIAAFYNDLSNQQLLLSLAPKPEFQGLLPSLAAVQNAGTSRIQGVEVETTLIPFDDLTLKVSYAYLDTKIKAIVFPTLPAASPYLVNSAAQPGDSLALTPRHKISIGVTYELPLAERLGRVALSANYTHSSKMISSYASRDGDGDITGFSLLQPRNLVDLALNWDGVFDTPLDLQLFATNLTNDRYDEYRLDLINPSGVAYSAPGLPRIYGARLRYRFGT